MTVTVTTGSPKKAVLLDDEQWQFVINEIYADIELSAEVVSAEDTHFAMTLLDSIKSQTGIEPNLDEEDEETL